jgi:hypothetical protein
VRQPLLGGFGPTTVAPGSGPPGSVPVCPYDQSGLGPRDALPVGNTGATSATGVVCCKTGHSRKRAQKCGFPGMLVAPGGIR